MIVSKKRPKNLIDTLLNEDNVFQDGKHWKAYEPLTESWAAYLEMRQKGISYRELSEIDMEIEAVRTIDDKRYINYRIQDDIGITSKFIEKIRKHDAAFMNARDLTPDDLKKYEDFIKELQGLHVKLQKRRPRGKEFGIIYEI